MFVFELEYASTRVLEYSAGKLQILPIPNDVIRWADALRARALAKAGP